MYVMRPTAPSPKSTPSYSCCARRIVRCAPKPSLRAASCCSVEVVNGGAGLRLRCLRSIDGDAELAGRGRFDRARAPRAACVSLVTVNCSTFSPRYSISRAGKTCCAFSASASIVQYSRGLKRRDLFLALADHAQRRALHAAGRGAGQSGLLPQQRRQIEADQVVERAARLLRVDQVLRDVARLRDRLADRVARDLVEHHAMHVLAVERAQLFQQLGQVPGDRFAFAVRVGREVQRVGLLQRARDRLHVLLVLVEDLIAHRELALRIDGAFLRHEVAHVTIGSQHLEILAEILLDGLRLGGRFHDDEILLLHKKRNRGWPRC